MMPQPCVHTDETLFSYGGKSISLGEDREFLRDFLVLDYLAEK